MEITERYRSAVRKNRVFVVIFALVFVFSLFSTLQASASTNLFKIQSVTLTDKSATVDGDISSSDDSKINSDIVFHQVGDYATYTVTLKNTDSEEHTIESITDDNTNANITYTYDSHANEQINADESFNLAITVTYVNAEADVNNRIQNSTVNIYIKYIGTDEPDIIPIVPNTSDNLIINATILVISAAGLIFCLFITFKKNKKYTRIFAVIISLTAVATVFVSVYAETVKTEQITVSYKYSLFDKVVVTYEDESGTEHQEVTNYGGTVSLPELTKTGYSFGGWKYEDDSDYSASDTFESDVKLSPIFTPNQYTIAFNANGGNGEMNSLSMTYDEAKNLTANSFTKTGHSFESWNTQADGEGNTYTNGQSVKNLSSVNGATVTLYAQWTANSYTISYDAGEGTGNMESTECTYGQSCALSSNTFTRTGYTFSGWKFNDQNFTDGQNVTNLAESGTVTLIAQWIPISYTIKFDANSGNGSMSDLAMTYDESKALTTNSFTKAGHSFANWNTQSDGEGDTYTNNQSVNNLSSENGATVTLYAQWTANSYTISYDANNGTGTMDDTNCTYGQNCALRTNSFTRAGYTFNGWKLNEQSFTDGQSVTNLAESGTVTLVAQWTANIYTISYGANTGAGDMEDTVCTYDSNCTLRANSFTKAGYAFSGWTYDNNTYTDGQNVINLAESGTITLVAQWAANTYTIVYDAYGGSGNMANTTCTYDASCTLRTNTYAKTGHSFSGWTYDNQTFTDGQGVTNLAESGTITLVAQWTANNYTINYNANGGSGEMVDTTCTYGQSCTLRTNSYTKTGHTFNGWKLDEESFTDGQNVTNLAESGSVTLVAQWTANNYTITYLSNDGTGDMEDTVCTYGASCQLRANSFTKTGHTFSGWLFDNQTYNDGQSVTNLATSGTITFIAQWTANDYTIVYDANNGSGDMANTNCVYGQSCALSSNTFTRTGYTFSGWVFDNHTYTDGQSVNNLVESGTVTLVAQWTPISYTIEFDANGGTGTMSDLAMTYDESKNLTANAYSKTGYTFANWTTVADGSGNSYTNTQSVSNLTSTDNDTVTLYAQWTANTYTISYNANGGSGNMADTTCTYDVSCTLSANSYTKTGYNFSGWLYNSQTYTNGQSVSNLATSGTITFVAQWTPISYTIEFNANGGTGTMSDLAMTYDESKNLTANAFSKTGYTFAGWTTAADGSGNSYTNTQSVSNLTTTNGDTVTLYAQWTANTYTISYDTNSGSGTMTDTTCTYDSSCTLRTNTYSKTGYTFSGWAYDNRTFTDGQSVTNLATSGTITLVAQWTANTYIISYDANSGSGTMTDTTCTYDSSCALSANAYAKTGYTFNGWLYDNQTYNDGQDVTNLATSGTITFVAQWTPISYTIAFNDNGGSGTMNPINTAYGTQVQLTPNAYVWPGYTFTGWNTAADGTGTDYTDNDTVDNLTTVNGDTVTLYAQWRQEQVLVCKAATQLHTEVCESSGSCNNVNSGTISGGSIYTVGSDKIITYGMIPSANSPKPGDAYDCDLTGNGVYDERFYALAVNDSRNLDLVYYTNYNNGPDVDSTAYYNDSLEKLPTKAQWSNPNLVEFSQDQISSLIPIEDLRSACSPGTTGITNIDVKRCIFTLENSSFRIDNRTFADGIWLEKINQSHYRIMTTSLAVNARPGNESLNATRPVIRVPLQLIEGVAGRSYTITYDNTGGDPIASDEVTSGDSIDHLPVATGVQNAYFSGWSLTSDGQSPINEYYIITGDVTLYAIWTQTSKTACAKGQYFNTLQEAINLVRDNNERTTVTLLQDTAEAITIAERQNIAFNLQNYTLSNVSASSHLIDNSGTLEISNGTITSSASQGSVNNLSTGTLIISGGTITNTGSKQAVWNDGGNVTITGNPIISNTTSGRATVHNLSDGTMTIEGGAITSNGGIAVYNQKGTLTIGKKDGSINTSSPTITAKTYGIVVYQNYDFNFYDGTISGKTYPNGYTAQDASGPTSITKDETDSKVSDIESGSTITKDTSSTYKTMYLTMAP